MIGEAGFAEPRLLVDWQLSSTAHIYPAEILVTPDRYGANNLAG